MGDLGDPGGTNTSHDDAAGTDDHSGHDEHGDILRGSLENSTDEGYGSAEGKAPATAPTVCNRRYEENTNDATQRVCRVENAEGRAAGGAEVIAPVRYGLEAIHHGAVETAVQLIVRPVNVAGSFSGPMDLPLGEDGQEGDNQP